MFDAITSLFDTLFVYPLTNLLIIVYNTLDLLSIPYALGFSIIIVTVIIRLLIYPFSKKQIEASKKMQDVAPELSQLKEKYKDDPKQLQAETMRVYRDRGINPFGSCLPTILQIIIFIALYNVFLTFLGADPQETLQKLNSIVYSQTFRIETPPDTHFFGLPLSSSPSSLLGVMPYLVVIPVITGALQLLQAKMMFPSNKKEDTKAITKKDSKKKDEPDFQSVMQKQMIFLIPISIGIAAYSFPLGLSLYWNTMTIFGMIQQYKITGWGGLAEWYAKLRPALSR